MRIKGLILIVLISAYSCNSEPSVNNSSVDDGSVGEDTYSEIVHDNTMDSLKIEVVKMGSVDAYRRLMMDGINYDEREMLIYHQVMAYQHGNIEACINGYYSLRSVFDESSLDLSEINQYHKNMLIDFLDLAISRGDTIAETTKEELLIELNGQIL